jgi:hypothetical protein
MAIQTQQFFYSGQIRRFLGQLIRMMSGFQVEFGKDRNGVIGYQTVPVFYGDPSRQAATILKNNSESMLSAVPAMAIYITGMRYDQNRMQEPYHVSKMNIRQKSYDPVTGEYGSTQDAAYTVERLMPVPYTVTFKLDMWTSNMEQKLQLFEQLGVLFNPSMEIQNTDNYIDWTSLTVVNRTDIQWTGRSVPAGNDDSQIDIMTWTFEIPIWITGPAKVKQLGVVQKIITSVFDETGALSQDAMMEGNLMMRRMLTPLGYGVIYSGNTLTLYKQGDIVANGSKVGTPDQWQPLIDVYGKLVAGVSQARLQLYAGFDEISAETTYVEVIGTVALNPADSTQLLFTPDIDTLPANTIAPINAIIDPTKVEVDAALLHPAVGARYLILSDIGSPDNFAPTNSRDNSSPIWGDVIAKADDIIEYNGSTWSVALNSSTTNTVEYVTNLKTGVQYKWLNGQWSKAVEGLYREGEWSIIL